MDVSATYPARQKRDATDEARRLLSDLWLRRIVGGLWLVDGLLQLQPAMFTMNMVNGIMAPTVQDQPALVAASLSWIIAFTTQHLALINWGIVLIQVALGLSLISGHWIKLAAITSIVWALVVWYAGEGMSLLLTGHASALTGAPGSVLLYAPCALVFLHRSDSTPLLGRRQLRWVLAGFWCFAALLQLQPFWWQSDQISQEIAGLYSPGTLGAVLVDPSLHWLASITTGLEVPLNLALIAVFLAVGVGLGLTKPARLKPWLVLSIALSVVIWWFNQALGMMFTGMSTDPNSGPLLVLLALAVWRKT